MAIVTRQEFADICGVDIKYLNVYISRKKVSVLSTDKSLVDSENPLNLIWKKGQKQKGKERVETARTERREVRQSKIEKPVEQIYKETVEIFTPKETLKDKKQREKQNEEDQESSDWDKRKKRADALKAERAAELAQLQVEKMMGNLMPVDLVEMILKVNIQDIFKTFENELINLASIYCDILAGGDRDKLSEIIKKLRSKLNDTVERVRQTAAQEVQNTVEDYAEVRNRGEKK